MDAGFDADGHGRGAHGIVAAVDMDALIRQIAGLPTAPVIAALDALVNTLVSAAPRAASRRVGLLGRLLGRDLVLQARPEPLDERVRVELLQAEARAAELRVALAALHDSRRDLAGQLSALETAVGPQSTADAGDGDVDPTIPRPQLLHGIADSWRAVLAHLAMAERFAASVLDRHADVRDRLVPLWREHGVAAAVGAQLRTPGAGRLHALGEQLSQQIAELGQRQAGHPTDVPPSRTENTP